KTIMKRKRKLQSPEKIRIQKKRMLPKSRFRRPILTKAAAAKKKQLKSHRTAQTKQRLKQKEPSRRNRQNLKVTVTLLKKRKMMQHNIKGPNSVIEQNLDLFHFSSFSFLFILFCPSLQSSSKGQVSHFGVLARQWYLPK